LAELGSAAPVSSCVHRWRISTPVGDLCNGVCSLCGAERSFTNERFPFGQPSRSRRPAPQVSPVLPPRFPASTFPARLLNRADAAPADGPHAG
jgi:hypothetical protein